MVKKLLCLILIFSLIFSMASFTSSAAAADDTMATLVSLVNRFPHGKYWNHVGKSNQPDGVTSTACASHSSCHWSANSCNCNSFDNSIQCMGYANKISYEITGVTPRNNYVKSYTLKASSLNVGDIIRYRWDGHSICVTGVKGNKISFTDCNFIGRCQIRWGVMDISDIIGFSYVLHLGGNDRKNSDLDFYENLDGYETEIDLSENHETWQMVDGVLNIRSDYNTAANIVGKIPAGAKFDIYDKYYDGEYMWGKVVYGKIMGWCALNYSEYIDGIIGRPNFKNANESYPASKTINLSWREVGGATKYWLYIYNSSGEVVKKYTVSGDSLEKNIKIYTPGKYTAKVIATSSVTPSWKIPSKIYSFSVVKADERIYVKSVSFTLPEKLAKGSSTVAEVTVKPASATDSGLKWKSSDSSIASVNSKGKITAKKIGQVTITCTAADRGKVSYKQTVSVVPETVTGIKQTVSSSSEITLRWSEVEDATLYAVYEFNSDTRQYEKLSNCKSNTYTLKASAGETYKIKVHALSKVGSKYYYSAPSEIFAAVSGPKTPKLTASKFSNKITLKWSKASGATHYIIYKVVEDKNVKVATETAEDTDFKYTVKNLEPGTYTYVMRAVRKVGSVTGYGSYSEAVSAKIK